MPSVAANTALTPTSETPFAHACPHLVEGGVVVGGIVMKQDQSLDSGLPGDLKCVLRRAVTQSCLVASSSGHSCPS